MPGKKAKTCSITAGFQRKDKVPDGQCEVRKTGKAKLQKCSLAFQRVKKVIFTRKIVGATIGRPEISTF